jgi:penicillin-binding protein 2
MVSAPTFNPALLVGRERGKNYLALTRDPYKPLYDRSLSAAYPPGSTFKPTQGLIGLQEGVINTSTAYGCSMGYVVGRFRLGCHAHPSPLSIVPAIATSCNAFFCAEFRAMLDNRQKYPNIQTALDKWKDYLVSMGYGYKTGVDLPSEGRGFIPNSKYYDKCFRTEKWKSLNIVSVSIGQGEILATPLQIANLAATIANRGYFVTPHVVKEIEDTPLEKEYTERRYTMVDRQHYETIVQGMAAAVTGGTCRIGAIDEIEVCGKTGTAQNPHGKDHSVFMGFAPKDNPKIAICVYVENAGFGATYGVPIGSLVMEKYLKGEISPARQWLEERMLTGNTLFLNTK